MIEAKADKPRNVLSVTYAQHVTPDETRPAVERLRRLLDELAPGFRLLTDLSRLDEMDLGCVPDVRKMMDLCDDKGVETVVRVIPDPQKDIGFKILSLFHYERRVRIVTCEALPEALKILAG